MNMLEKLKNLLMPEVIEEEELAETEEEAAEKPLQVVNGVPFGSPVTEPKSVMAPPRPQLSMEAERPPLSVRTTQVEELAVDIHVPTAFAQVAGIADDLIAKKAAIVNYERVEGNEQRRICDFINGVCYTIDGEARRISDGMVLYVPAGVNVVSARPTAAKK